MRILELLLSVVQIKLRDEVSRLKNREHLKLGFVSMEVKGSFLEPILREIILQLTDGWRLQVMVWLIL